MAIVAPAPVTRYYKSAMSARFTVNRYSYLIATGLAMGGAWVVGSRFGGPAPTLAVAGVGIAMALVQRTLRGGASAVDSWNDVLRQLGHGKPALLFIYSDT